MSRPSAYSSLMAIMVSQPCGAKEASDSLNPMGFLTSSSSTGEPLTSITSPRPKAGVTADTASISESASLRIADSGTSAATARTRASAAAALYRL